MCSPRGIFRAAMEYSQLLKYREALDNPPLLIVSDIRRIQIHTNFTGTAKQVHEITLDPAKRAQIGAHYTSREDILWFELARRMIEKYKHVRTGLLATQAIRNEATRDVLERIKHFGDIFLAWSDREWVLDGAAVHISMVGFDDGSETVRVLDGQPAAIDPQAGIVCPPDRASPERPWNLFHVVTCQIAARPKYLPRRTPYLPGLSFKHSLPEDQ